MRAASLTSLTSKSILGRATTALALTAILAACSADAPTGTPSKPGNGSGQTPVPTRVTVERVELTGAAWLVEQGSASYSATVVGSNGSVLTDRVVTWLVSDTAVAAVSNGVVYAKRAGETTLYAISENKSAAVRVAVRPLTVDSIALRITRPLYAGETSQVGAELRAADGRILDRLVSFTSLDPSIVSIGYNGELKGHREGIVDIVGTSEGRTATVTITVQPARASGTWTIDIPELRSASTLCSYRNLAIGLRISGEQVTGELLYDMWNGRAGELTCVAIVGGTGTPSAPPVPAGPFTGTLHENGYLVLRSSNGWEFAGMVNRATAKWTGSVYVADRVDGAPVEAPVRLRTGTFTASK